MTCPGTRTASNSGSAASTASGRQKYAISGTCWRKRRVVFSGNRARYSRGRVQCVTSSLLLLAITLITTSCGTVSAAPATGGQSLALSGTLPGGSVNQSYNAVLSVSGGASPYHFAIGSGVLPPGLTLNPSTGSFTGTPSTPGGYTFQVVVTDSPHPDQGTQSYAVTIGGGSGGGVKVSVAPASVMVVSGGIQQFTATVTGT